MTEAVRDLPGGAQSLGELGQEVSAPRLGYASRTNVEDPAATLDVSEGGLVDAFGMDWFEIKEGEASIFKPAGGGQCALIARVQIGQWATAKK